MSLTHEKLSIHCKMFCKLDVRRKLMVDRNFGIIVILPPVCLMRKAVFTRGPIQSIALGGATPPISSQGRGPKPEAQRGESGWWGS